MAQGIETKKKGSFQKNVIITFLTISIISLAATGAISLGFVNLMGDYTTVESTDALESQIETNMALTAQQNALVINQKLSSAESMVLSMAEECERIFSPDSTFEHRTTYYDYFFENTEDGPHPSDVAFDPRYGLNVSWTYSSWYVAGSNSTNYATYETQNQERLGLVSNMDYTFQSIHNQMPEFRWLYITFADNGMFINYPGSDLGGSDLARNTEPWYPTLDDWYIEIENGEGDMVFVDPYYDPIDQVLLISIGKAIYFENGTLIGIIAGDITIESINDKILDVTILETGYASLILQDGSVIAHPDLSPEDYEYGLVPLYQVETNTDASRALSPDQMAQITSGQTGILRYTKDGEEYLLAYTSVGKAGYICTISVPVSEVLDAIPALENRIAEANVAVSTFIIAITVGGIILAGGAAVVVARQITGPLQYLMDLAMKNVSAMIQEAPTDTLDLQVDTEYTGKDDEIGELARAFQGMLDTIREDEM
ncbi:MAG: hypothetical protein BAJATHORv1_10213 [Candidatus Thorarchaeota archaeon]|nr:MAG: hypothetical protein BAJATHORv1_10213 [Candidatus Thorarchaeota archaeon]